MAEAYFNSKGVPGVKAISSGVRAQTDENGPITWPAIRILKNSGLISSMTEHWTQTTKELLDKSDLVIFMQENHFNYAVKNFDFNSAEYDIWNIKDVGDMGIHDITQSLDEDMKLIKVSEETFAKIKTKIDKLVHGMKEKHILDRLSHYQ